MAGKTKAKSFRDPLHGLIEFDRSSAQDQILLELIDTPEFQRLRRIRQLGLAFYAYPGAEHTRFTHSLGVTHLTDVILRRLCRDYPISADQTFLARCAALLHDVGHAPFSHVLEKFFQQRPGARGGHEDWSLRIVLDPDSAVHRLLSAADLLLPALVADLLNHHYQPRFLCHLLASQLDADRFDYLLRDSLLTGVKHGVYDLERLIRMLAVDASGDQLIVTEEGVYPVEQYLLARYHMFRQVYQHKTVIAAESIAGALLNRAACLAREGRLSAPGRDTDLGRILRAENAADISIADYLAFDDGTFWNYLKVWSGGPDPILGDLSRRLLTRELFKTKPLDAQAPDFSARIGAACDFLERQGCNPEYYLLLYQSADTPYKPYDPAGREPSTSIFVRDASRPAGYVEIIERSAIVQSLMRENYSITHVVYPAHVRGIDVRAKIEVILFN